MATKKEKLTHIQVKDNGIKAANKVGDKLAETKSELETKIISGLITNANTNNVKRWRIEQNNRKRRFQSESKQITDRKLKEVKTALNNDKSVNLKQSQVNSLVKEVKDGMLFIQQDAIKTYGSVVKNVLTEIRSKKAIELKDALSRHIASGLDIGVVYKDGKEFQFDTYFEMKARTEIQVEIKDNLIDAGKDVGVIFYITAFYGDCAKDHADYQGKIYYDDRYQTIAPKDRLDEIESYINSNKLKSVQEITEAPVYLTSRPNCRHYFMPMDIDSVLGAKTEKDVNKLREENGLNFNGKYKPEKYKALQKQRLNERKIRVEKQEIQRNELQLALDPMNKAIRNNIIVGQAKVARYQAEQRDLIKQYRNLERSYDREQLNNRVDMDVKSKDLTHHRDYGIINIEIDEYTPCLRRKDGVLVKTTFEEIKPKRISEMKFKWNVKSHDDDKLYVLYADGDTRIQGAMFIRKCPDDHSMRVDLVESAKHNRIDKEYTGVGAHLFAEAIKQSYENGFDGDVTFTSKTNLKNYYMEKLGAVNIIDNEMLITGEASKKLFERYYGEKNGE